jgi:DNA-binding HxlR family transcriptional regulator
VIPGNTNYPDKPDCRALGEILDVVGNKWTVMVVGYLSLGPKRFNELRRLGAGVTQRMLTRTLRRLEREGLVSRTVFPTVPPGVEYGLTSRGHTLVEPLQVLAAWAVEQRVIREATSKSRSYDSADPCVEPPSLV